jgi:hypothetical protein
MASKKQEMINFLEQNNVPYPAAATKAILLEKINTFAATVPESFNKKVVEEICSQMGVEVRSFVWYQ